MSVRNSPPLIGLMGVAGSGKDTVAKYLTDYGYERLAFADAVKEMALAINPIIEYATSIGPSMRDDVPCYIIGYTRLSFLVENAGWDEAKKQPDVRQLLQRIGTEAVRDIIGYDTWVKIIDRQVRVARGFTPPYRHPGQYRFALTDCRFPNEAEWIRDMEGVIWRITRPGAGTLIHSSETLLESITPDVTIHNTGTLEDLQNAVVVVLAGGSKEVDAGELRGRAHSGWREQENEEKEI